MNGQIRYGAATDIGKVRELNEDSLVHEPPLFAVADGMGGHSAGDVASRMAVEALSRQVIDNSDALSAAVKQANREIHDRSKAESDLGGMGTTITALVATDGSAQIAHVGDSRAYLLRDGELERLTQDHTVVGRLVQQGRISEEDAEHHPQRSYLERALGVDADVDIDINVLDTRPGDRLMLCSDGLYTMISEDEIAQVLDAEDDPQQAAQRLCDMAVAAGGLDNVTAMVIDYPGERTPLRPTTGDQPRSKLPKRLLAVAITLALLLTALALARASLDRNYYVGARDGEVVIFKGIPGSFAGIDLSRPEEQTGVSTRTLPAPERSRLEEGIEADDLGDAHKIVANLKRVASPAASPSPSPGAVP